MLAGFLCLYIHVYHNYWKVISDSQNEGIFSGKYGIQLWFLKFPQSLYIDLSNPN